MHKILHMKLTIKTISLAFVLYLIPYILSSQHTGKSNPENRSSVFKKLYLHTDRDLYFMGDSIWFKAYYLDGYTQTFISGTNSMYTDLVLS